MQDLLHADQVIKHAEDFFKVGRNGAKARADDREKGASIFLRLNDGARVDLIARILDNWLDEEELNLAMVSGALRHAWDSEPYTGGVRVGSYVTSAVARLRDALTPIDVVVRLLGVKGGR